MEGLEVARSTVDSIRNRNFWDFPKARTARQSELACYRRVKRRLHHLHTGTWLAARCASFSFFLLVNSRLGGRGFLERRLDQEIDGFVERLLAREADVLV